MRRFRTSVAVSTMLAAALAVMAPGGAANADTTMTRNDVPECVVNVTEPVSNGKTMTVNGSVICPKGSVDHGWMLLWFNGSEGVENGVAELQESGPTFQATVVAPCVEGTFRGELFISLHRTSGGGGFNVGVSKLVTIAC
ncbi:hypothetical protein ACFHYQ_11485 [Sphaerimonospora cavernae]|uniref:Secreted protein n=1 Tax=Sphaerimonospora cavernae TaxID=1740611 RepID=A0ABV6U4Y3_9ACTN